MTLLKSLLAASVLLAGARAQVSPTEPSPGSTYNEGANCAIRYSLDTTGTWTNVTVTLMTGSNLAMVELGDVITGLDGTTGTGSLSYPCPDVEPNAPVYFYQFSNNGINPTWTTRFTIASSTGATVPAPNATQPNGDAIGWGIGELVGTITPATAGGSSATNGTASTSPTLSVINATSSATSTSASSTVTVTSTSATSASETSTTSSAAPSATSTGAAGKVDAVKSWAVGALVLLGAALVA